MPTLAEIVHEELAAAEARIAERLAGLLGSAPAPSRAPLGKTAARVATKEKPRFQGRVRARLSHADVAEGRRKVLAAVKGGARTAGELQRATGLSRHRVTYVANQLREEGKLRRRGTRRTAKYFPG